MIIFETERLIVRPYTLADGDIFFALNGDAAVMRYIRPAKSREECDRFLLEVVKYSEENPLYGRWAAEDKNSGHFIGSFSMLPLANTGQMHLGYALLSPYWGLGYAAELARKGLEYTFLKTPLTEIFAITEDANEGSKQVLIKAGFVLQDEYVEEEKQMVKYRRGKGNTE